MKIKAIETFHTKTLCVVRVQTDEGHVGYGQTAPYHADITSVVVHQQAAKHFLGAEVQADRIDALVDHAVVQEHKFPGSYVCRAVGGIDTALWDLVGRQEGKSVCELLGGKPGPIAVYGSSMRRDITPKDEAERLARMQGTYGFRAFKIRVGNNFGNDVDRWPGRTEEIVPAVRKAIGNEIVLLVDGNSGFTPKRAIEVGRMLEQYNCGHFEEPCPYPELEWTAEVAAALTIPVAGGEQDTDLAHFRRMIRMKAVDIVQPDVCYVGGISRALRVAKMAGEAGLPCTPHAANQSMVTVFTLHLLGAIPNGGPFMELGIEEEPWLQGFLTNPLQVRDGTVSIPDGPGWGVEIQPSWLEKAQYRKTECS